MSVNCNSIHYMSVNCNIWKKYVSQLQQSGCLCRSNAIVSKMCQSSATPIWFVRSSATVVHFLSVKSNTIKKNLSVMCNTSKWGVSQVQQAQFWCRSSATLSKYCQSSATLCVSQVQHHDCQSRATPWCRSSATFPFIYRKIACSATKEKQQKKMCFEIKNLFCNIIKEIVCSYRGGCSTQQDIWGSSSRL